jgi:hypothetical protein
VLRLLISAVNKELLPIAEMLESLEVNGPLTRAEQELKRAEECYAKGSYYWNSTLENARQHFVLAASNLAEAPSDVKGKGLVRAKAELGAEICCTLRYDTKGAAFYRKEAIEHLYAEYQSLFALEQAMLCKIVRSSNKFFSETLEAINSPENVTRRHEQYNQVGGRAYNDSGMGSAVSLVGRFLTGRLINKERIFEINGMCEFAELFDNESSNKDWKRIDFAAGI